MERANRFKLVVKIREIGFTLGLLCFTICPVGCTRLDGPAGIVRKAFDAFQEHNSNGVTELMSQQGLANSALYCQGAAINCLDRNYAAGGKVEGISTRIISQSNVEAKIELRTAWSGVQGERCQTYTLDKTDAGWRITFFELPQPCSAG